MHAADRGSPVRRELLEGGSGQMTVSSDTTRSVAEQWFRALRSGHGEEALSCLDKDVVWINNPPEAGLSDIIPWLGEYRGIEAVRKTFAVWAERAEVRSFELRKLVIDGDEALGVVHEVAEVKATALCYDIEFIQRFRVGDSKIVFWTSYWDTVKGIVPFRGDLRARLIAAAEKGDEREALNLLPFGADPGVRDERSGLTALMIAAARGHAGLVRMLIRFGADPNAVDRRAGASALHKACQGGHLEAVKALIEAGARIDLQAASTGHTPLFEAIWFKSDAIVDLLLKHDARIEVLTHYGFTIDRHIEYALNVNKGEAGLAALNRIKEMVRERRASDDSRQCAGGVNQAVLEGNLEGVRTALARGGDLDERFPIVGKLWDGHTPLLIASLRGHVDIVRELIERGADVNAIEPVFGAVPLHKATYNGHTEITRLLVKAKGVNLDYQGPANGYTPLHDALWHAYPDSAQPLIDAGARLDIVAYDGKLPVDIAVEELGPEHPIVGQLKERASGTKAKQPVG